MLWLRSFCTTCWAPESLSNRSYRYFKCTCALQVAWEKSQYKFLLNSSIDRDCKLFAVVPETQENTFLLRSALANLFPDHPHKTLTTRWAILCPLQVMLSCDLAWEGHRDFSSEPNCPQRPHLYWSYEATYALKCLLFEKIVKNWFSTAREPEIRLLTIFSKNKHFRPYVAS